MKQQPTINDQQTEILTYLYRFRFLTRSQIQTLLSHKFHSKTILWLNEMTKSRYTNKQQSLGSTRSYYSLGINGRKYLIKHKLVKQPILLSRVWREANYSTAFREKCVFLADLYLHLVSKSGGALRFWTKTDLAGVQHLPEPAPDAYFVIGEKSEADRYFIEIPTNSTTKNVTDQIERHAEHYFSGEWQEHISKDFPQVIVICSNKSAIRAASRYVKEEYSDDPDLRFRVASSDQALSEILKK